VKFGHIFRKDHLNAIEQPYNRAFQEVGNKSRGHIRHTDFALTTTIVGLGGQSVYGGPPGTLPCACPHIGASPLGAGPT
jgi:hypothetical protein